MLADSWTLTYLTSLIITARTTNAFYTQMLAFTRSCRYTLLGSREMWRKAYNSVKMRQLLLSRPLCRVVRHTPGWCIVHWHELEVTGQLVAVTAVAIVSYAKLYQS